MKNILMIGTGGTIASEMTPEGLTPELNTHQLLSYLPRIAQLCHVDCIQLYSLDSTSIHPAHWLGTAQAIREHYDDYDGFVISHGTDTMAYTAAALSYLVQDPIWRWCRMSICYSTSVVRAGHGRYFMTGWTPMWGC